MAESTPLSAQATEYLSTLATADYPKELAERYPRIINSIVSMRHNERDLREYFESLLNDKRGGRQGFPLGVLLDIQNLKEKILGPDTDPKGVVRWV